MSIRTLPALGAILLALAAAAPAAAQGARIVVGPGEAVTSIAAALELARDGDHIVVRAGSYAEAPLTVSSSVRLEGEGWPVLDGAEKAPVLLIVADGVEVSGFRIRGAPVSHVNDHAAIRVEGARDCVIEGNLLEDNFFGIYLAQAAGCRVEGNVIRASGTRESASGNGIHLWNATDVTIRDNQVSGHRDGIYLEHARDAVVEGNISEGNLRYGLHFMFSDRTSCSANEFRRNGAGVALMYSRNARIDGNTFESNWGPTSYGILLKEITDGQVLGNLFLRNTTALHSEGSDRLEVRGNRFLRNGWAVRVLASSQENRFTGNDFIDNTFDVTTNSRRSFNTFEGNHWSRYRGYDLAGNGVGDVPHRPVRLFALIVERTPTALILLRSLFVDMLDVAERVLPALTPETLVDERPMMREVAA